MTWKVSNPMDEKIKFIAKLINGEKMTTVCREFGIFRKTGYKIWERYKDSGMEALQDRSHRPYRHANKLPFQIERSILQIKQYHPSWGAPKIREILLRQYPLKHPPATSTVHVILDRHGLVKRHKHKRYKARGTELIHVKYPNQLWCSDYKDEFLQGKKSYCYPLTITDYSSRYLLACESLDSTRENLAFTVFEQVFKEFGLPDAIRTDNGIPFSSPNALFGLSKLSVWWLRFGIAIERIKPGNPQQNGRHERMYLTLKNETTKPPAFNFLQQQEKFDKFMDEYNNERPHQALAMRYPGEIYVPSPRTYQGLPEVSYPYHDKIITVTQCGRICIGRKKINFSTVFAGQVVGIREIEDRIWLVSFMNFDLGYFDEDSCRVEPLDNPFREKVLPISSV